MFNHRRNQRSKGFKPKHALQLMFVLGVCIWLLYQVRRSHDKETTLSESSKSVNQVAKLGRKDLRPQREGISVVDARHKEEEGERDEDSKNDEHNRSDENENHNVGNSGEDDDTLIRQHGLNKDEDADHGQETVDQDKENEASNETTDAEKENEEHGANDTEETESEERKESKSSVDQIEENEENVAEKIELNESADDVSKVNRLEDNSTESEEKESGDSKAEENVQKEETEKEEENNVDEERGENEVEDSQEHEKDKEEDEQQKIEDPVTSGYHVQDGSDGKVEEAREEHYIRDNASSAVDHPNQNDPQDNSTETNTKSADFVDGNLSQSIANVIEHARDENNSSSTAATHQGDGSESESNRVDDSQEGSITESRYQLLEEGNSGMSDSLDSSVQNGSENTFNTTDQQFETMHNTTSEGDNHDMQNTELKKTQESNPSAGNDKSLSTSTTTGASNGEDPSNGEFRNSTTNPDLQNIKSSGDKTSEPSQSDKPDSNATTGTKQENALKSETNDDVPASKDENFTSSENIAKDGESPKENQEAVQKEQISSSNNVSLQDEGTTEQNVNDGISHDENVTSSENTAKENQEAGQDEQINASNKSTLQDNGNLEQKGNENAVETMTDGIENAAQENINDDAGQDDKNRSTDSSMPQNVKEAGVDLGTLPYTTEE